MSLDFETPQAYCLHLIHTKAYFRAAEMAATLAVLDIGCNNGYGTKILSTRCQRVVGVDVSENAIESARKANANTEIEFQVINGKTLPFGDQTFDLVTSFQVIEHVADVEPFLLEITRVLKAGGRAIFTTPNCEIRLWKFSAFAISS